MFVLLTIPFAEEACILLQFSCNYGGHVASNDRLTVDDIMEGTWKEVAKTDNEILSQSLWTE
jgi:hypothetical protein